MFVRPDPRQFPQAGEHSMLCFLHVHRRVLQSVMQLHMITRSRFSGAGPRIFFFCGSKLLLPGARPGSKTNFLVAKLDVHFLRSENILILYIVFPQQSFRGHLRLCSWTHYKHYTKMHAWSCTKSTIPRIYGSSKCLLPHEHPGRKWENMVSFATIATTNFEPWGARSVCGGTNLMSHYCHHHSVERRPPAETLYSWTCRYSRRLWYIAAPDVWW